MEERGDMGSRPYETHAFAEKPTGVIGIAVGASGTAPARQHLRNVPVYLDVAALPRPEVFIGFIDGLIDEQHKCREHPEVAAGFVDS
jgi:chromate reductase, NAD(P)H dehydrogenase (quinone)